MSTSDSTAPHTAAPASTAEGSEWCTYESHTLATAASAASVAAAQKVHESAWKARKDAPPLSSVAAAFHLEAPNSTRPK